MKSKPSRRICEAVAKKTKEIFGQSIPDTLTVDQKARNAKLKEFLSGVIGMTDSGKRQEFETGAVRDSADDKPRPDLISPYANEREGAWLAAGAKKYLERNWEQGMPISRCIASLERHVIAYKKGKRDEDHMAAIRTNAGFILHYEAMIKLGVLPKELDDMPKYEGVEK